MKNLIYLIAVMALLVVGQIAQGACYESCDQWASGVVNGYWVGNDMWNPQGTWSQCIYVNSKDDWWITALQPTGDGNVKSYAHIALDIGKKQTTNISQLSSLTSSFSCTVPSVGYFDASYDIWVPSEIMIWFVNQGNVNPIAETYDASGKAIPSVTNLTLGGHTWNVYHRSGSTITFMRTSNATSGTVDILALINWAKNTQGWIGDGNVTDVEFGFEVFDTSGQTLTFKCTGYTVNFVASNWSGGGATGTDTTTITCGSTTTTAASTTTTAASTTTTAASTTTTAATTSTTSASTSTTTTSATTSTTAASTTTTTAAASCTCDSGCDGTAISPNFTKDGAGQFCWQATSGTYINSWNLNKLEVNNTVYTNTYVFTSSFPAKINGVWYIYYDSSVAWGHFELKN